MPGALGHPFRSPYATCTFVPESLTFISLIYDSITSIFLSLRIFNPPSPYSLQTV